MFSRCSVQIVPFVRVFLMYLWKEISSKSYSSAILVPSYNACDLCRLLVQKGFHLMLLIF